MKSNALRDVAVVADVFSLALLAIALCNPKRIAVLASMAATSFGAARLMEHISEVNQA